MKAAILRLASTSGGCCASLKSHEQAYSWTKIARCDDKISGGTRTATTLMIHPFSVRFWDHTAKRPESLSHKLSSETLYFVRLR